MARSYMQRVIKKILLDVALVAFILVELLLAALLCSLLPISIGIPLFLVTPFSIGAVSYFIFQRVTPKQRIREEAEDWLAKRARGLMPYRAKSRTGKRVAIWIPTIVVTVLLLFFPETFGILLHVMYPTSGKLLRYRVSFPATWMVGDTSMNESHTWAFAGAFECKGPFRAGLTRYTHGNPPASAMEFWDSPGGDPATRQPPSGTLFSNPHVPARERLNHMPRIHTHISSLARERGCSIDRMLYPTARFLRFFRWGLVCGSVFLSNPGRH
jgi:hypothetical protein